MAAQVALPSSGCSPATELRAELSQAARGSPCRQDVHARSAQSCACPNPAKQCRPPLPGWVCWSGRSEGPTQGVAELDTEPVPAGAVHGQTVGSSPEAAPVPPATPRELAGEHLGSGQPRPRGDAAPALGSGQGQAVNHSSSDAAAACN